VQAFLLFVIQICVNSPGKQIYVV